MNTKFLITASFLLALLLHLFVFHFCTFMFSINPGSPKPKFFFLGPILQQSDINLGFATEDKTLKDPLVLTNFDKETPIQNVQYEIMDPEKNPFSINPIKKPIMPQTKTGQEKLVIKSTFQTPPEKEEVETKESSIDLNIQPYQPLRSRLP